MRSVRGVCPRGEVCSQRNKHGLWETGLDGDFGGDFSGDLECIGHSCGDSDERTRLRQKEVHIEYSISARNIFVALLPCTRTIEQFK